MPRCSAKHGSFHDDAILAYYHGTSLGSNDGTEKNATVRADCDVPGDDSIWRDISGGVNAWSFAAMLDQQSHGTSKNLGNESGVSGTDRSCFFGYVIETVFQTIFDDPPHFGWTTLPVSDNGIA
jgi:hypothetical protein